MYHEGDLTHVVLGGYGTLVRVLLLLDIEVYGESLSQLEGLLKRVVS